MKKLHIISRPTHVNDLSYNDWYDDISHDWHQKAQKLQIRRWRTLKRAMKEDDSNTS